MKKRGRSCFAKAADLSIETWRIDTRGSTRRGKSI